MILHWTTDLHLDHCQAEEYREFVENVKQRTPPFLLLAGDIAEGASVTEWLSQISTDLSCPIYFVLGNHDFYGASIEKTRKAVEKAAEQNTLLTYLSPLEHEIEISPNVALIGHDGWADGKADDYTNSNVVLRDYVVINDLAVLDKETRRKKLNSLGEESATQLAKQLESALEHYTTVVCITHAPPFSEACLYENQPSSPDWAPHFVNSSLGDMLLQTMKQHPENSLLVLCGHTHHKAECSPLPNLRVIVGAAEYGNPSLQPPLELH
jgi:predicted MPP superfamily phosphohydrolase